MTETQAISLRRERSRLLDAWRNAKGSNKMSILVMIDDIDAQLERHNFNKPLVETPRRRFYR